MSDQLTPSYPKKTTREKDGRSPRTQATSASCEFGIPSSDNLNNFADCVYCAYEMFLRKFTCPLNLTCQLIRTTQGYIQDKNVIAQIPKVAPFGTWFPNITADLCKFYHPYDPEISPHLPYAASVLQRRQPHFYMCPQHNAGRDWKDQPRCGGWDDYYYTIWSCVSTGYLWWNTPLKTDYISLKYLTFPTPGHVTERHLIVVPQP